MAEPKPKKYAKLNLVIGADSRSENDSNQGRTEHLLILPEVIPKLFSIIQGAPLGGGLPRQLRIEH